MAEGDEFLEEKVLEPINVLLAFLIAIASILFVLGVRGSFNLDEYQFIILISIVIVIYSLVVLVLLKPKKVLKKIPKDKIIERINTIERPVIREVQVPKTVIKYKDRPAKEVIREVERPVLAVVDRTKKEPKKSKFVGSTYTESYHVRTCRFAGVIKPEYLIEEDDGKYFKLRGYKACKTCRPDKH